MALLGRLGRLCWAVLGPSKSDAKTRSMKAPFWEEVSSEIAILGPQEGVLNLGPRMPTPSALPQVYSFRLTDRTRSALSVIWGPRCQPPLHSPKFNYNERIAREARFPLPVGHETESAPFF